MLAAFASEYRLATLIGAKTSGRLVATSVYRSARNIEGVEVAPVAEFNTYDILKQRYLLLTREALAALKERVKAEPARRAGPAAAAEAAPAPAAPES